MGVVAQAQSGGGQPLAPAIQMLCRGRAILGRQMLRTVRDGRADDVAGAQGPGLRGHLVEVLAQGVVGGSK